jgi:hypothetical protein
VIRSIGASRREIGLTSAMCAWREAPNAPQNRAGATALIVKDQLECARSG